VGKKPAAFHRKAEAGWRLISPVLDRRFGWQSIEAIVDLNGLEVLDIPGQVFRTLQFLRTLI